MDNEKKNNDEMFEAETVTLLDEYFALIPAGSADEDGGFSEYIILKSVRDADGEEELVEIEDDAEFDRVAATFDDAFDAEYDYDAE